VSDVAGAGRARAPGPPQPRVVVVGAASRDVTDDDPRGWRLGGSVTYGALTLARLGVRTGAVIGLDALAAEARELRTLRSEGVDVVPVPLQHGPVFVNRERAAGRLQQCVDAADPVAAEACPETWRAVRHWLLGPVAAELPEPWAAVPPGDAVVALGWQGLLRSVVPGQPVRGIAPAPSRLLARADLVAASRGDLPREWPLEEAVSLLRRGTELLVTLDTRGGLLWRGTDRTAMEDDHERSTPAPRSTGRLIRFSAVPARRVADPTGAGDVLLATLVALRLAEPPVPDESGWLPSRRRQLAIAAAAASLVVERPGLDGVPDLAQLRHRVGSRHPFPEPL
jgi:sugar/nucleoside kinase (ribokinase family)